MSGICSAHQHHDPTCDVCIALPVTHGDSDCTTMPTPNSSKEFEKAVYEAIVYGIKNTTPHRLLEYEKRDVELAVTELIAAHHKASQELVRQTLERLEIDAWDVEREPAVTYKQIELELSKLEGGEK